MAQKYKVLERSFIHNAIVEPGTVVEYDGKPGPNLVPLDKDGNEKPQKDPPIA